MKSFFIALALFIGASTAQADGHKDFQLCVNGICVGNGGIGIQHPGYNDPYRPDYGDYYGSGYGDYTGSELMRCESINRRYNECYFDGFRVRNVRLYRQHSKAACIRGQTYGIFRDTVWVQGGCRATFEIIR
jgi:hypothetical protein